MGILMDFQTLKACLFFLITSSFLYAIIRWDWRSRRAWNSQFLSAIEIVGDGITLSDQAGKFTLFNPKIQQIAGYTMEEANNCENFAALLYPNSQAHQQAIARLTEVLQSTDHNIEVTIQAKNGTQKTLLISTSVMRYQNQELFLSIYRDISDRKQTEAHMRLLESVAIHTNDAIIITNAEPIRDSGPSIVYVNNAFTQMTGYSFEEAIGKTPRILQGPKSDRSQLDKIRAALETWQPVRVELLNYRKDGSEFWVEINIVPVADEAGWFTHWISVQRDITEHKKVEAALRESQQHYKLAVTSGKLGLWDWNLKTQEIYLDPNLKALMGFEADEISNHVNGWGQLVYPDDREQVIVAANNYLEGLTPDFEIEYRMLHQNGSIRWVYARGNLIWDGDGEPDHLVDLGVSLPTLHHCFKALP